MVTIKMKNHTPNFRVMADPHGAGAHLKIAVGGNLETDALTLEQLRLCEADVRASIKSRYVSLLAFLGRETREVSYDEAIILLTRAEPPSAGFTPPPGMTLLSGETKATP
jgi:hypothetical protein